MTLRKKSPCQSPSSLQVYCVAAPVWSDTVYHLAKLHFHQLMFEDNFLRVILAGSGEFLDFQCLSLPVQPFIKQIIDGWRLIEPLKLSVCEED